MRLKAGFQACPRCGGSGCYWCRREGWRASCPKCGNEEPELLARGAEGITCGVCGAFFDSGGRVISDEADSESRKKK